MGKHISPPKETSPHQPPTKQREGDQVLPIQNNHPFIQDLVMADIEARKQIGISRYGTALQPHNGRDSLLDAYEEALDLAVYLKQCLIERDTEPDSEIPPTIMKPRRSRMKRTSLLNPGMGFRKMA